MFGLNHTFPPSLLLAFFHSISIPLLNLFFFKLSFTGENAYKNVMSQRKKKNEERMRVAEGFAF